MKARQGYIFHFFYCAVAWNLSLFQATLCPSDVLEDPPGLFQSDVSYWVKALETAPANTAPSLAAALLECSTTLLSGSPSHPLSPRSTRSSISSGSLADGAPAAVAVALAHPLLLSFSATVAPSGGPARAGQRRWSSARGGHLPAAAAPWWSSRIPVAALRWRSSRGSPVMHSCMCLLHLLPLCCSVCSCVQSIPFPTWSRERRFHPGRGSGVQLDFTDTDAVEALRGAPGMPYGAWLLPVLPLCTRRPHLLHHVSHPLSWCGIDLFDWFNLLVPGWHRFRVWWCDVSHPVSWCGFSQLSICRSGYACSHLFIAYYLITKALIC